MEAQKLLTLCLVVLLGLVQVTYTLSFQDLFPFGEARGDSILKSGDDTSSTEIPLKTAISFYDEKFSGIFVNNNGHLSFGTDIPVYQPNLDIPFGYNMIAAFFADIDTTYAGTVYYRETQNQTLLQKAGQVIQNNFENYYNFIPESLFVATWDNVGYFDANDTFLNTFQIVVGSDGVDSFAGFFYLKNGTNWITSVGKYPETPETPAQAGFSSSNSDNMHFLLPYSGTIDAYKFQSDSNVGEEGLWVYQIGDSNQILRPLGDVAEELIPVLANFDPIETPCVQGRSQCHLSAECVDYGNGFCCECLPNTYGNGKSCLTTGAPLRLSGKLNGEINGFAINDLDMLSYVVTVDGRAYTSFSGISPEIGMELLTLNTIGGIVTWLFAEVTNPRAKNGYMLTGGKLRRTATVTYSSGEEVTISQVFHGPNDINEHKMETTVTGNIPDIPDGAKVNIDDYIEEYNHVAMGTITSSSARKYRVNDVDYDYTWNQTITYEECQHDPALHSSGDVMKLNMKRQYVVYNDLDEYVQFILTGDIGVTSDNDPCLSADCGENTECVSGGVGSVPYTCLCNIGYYDVRGGIDNRPDCQDIDECTEIQGICDVNAACYNVPGSFQCQCAPGFRGDGRTCERSVRKCGEDICDANARCVFNSDLNRPMCECKSGFTGDGVSCSMQALTCNEVDNCHPDAECLYDDVQQTYYCECGEGFSGDGYYCDGFTSTECNCDQNAQCVFDVDTLSRQCQCNVGYTGNGQYCSPIMVPEGCENCHSNAHCVAAADGYVCECLQGYHGNGEQCEATDCQTMNNCDPNADCVNDPFLGVHRCLCRNGFQGDGVSCSPEDCSVQFNCDVNADCVLDPRDSRRSMCRCRESYSGDGYTCRPSVVSCNQVNNCHQNAQCIYDPNAQSYRCRCNRGYEGSGVDCRVRGYDCRRDARICDANAECVLNVDSFVCVCMNGFQGDGRRCIAIDHSDNYLLFSRGYTIQKMPFTGDNHMVEDPILYDTQQLVVAIDTNCDTKTMYFTDVYNGHINMANLDGTNVQTIVSNLKSPEGLAVDWLSKNIYWTDSGMNTLSVSGSDGTYKKTLFDSDMRNPRAIVLDPAQGYMYWTDWSRDAPQIEKAMMDGQERMSLVTSDLGLPNGLTINYQTQQICWGDAGVNTIECVRTDGVGRRTVTENAPYPFSITSLSNELYWSDWSLKGVSMVNQNGGDVEDMIDLPIGGNGKLYGITAVQESCPRQVNACVRDNGGCQYLCLPTPNGGRTCVCPDNVDCDSNEIPS